MREPIICAPTFTKLFQLFAKFVDSKYYTKLADIVVDGPMIAEFDWAFKIQVIPNKNRYTATHYIVAGRNALGIGYYLTDYKKTAG